MGNFARQCVLTRSTRQGRQSYVAWLPEKWAVQGTVVKLRDDGGPWDDGWRIQSVGPQRRTLNYINERSRDYLNQRKASDV